MSESSRHLRGSIGLFSLTNGVDASVQRVLAAYGTVLSIKVLRDPDIVYVCYEFKGDAVRAAEEITAKSLLGKAVARCVPFPLALSSCVRVGDLGPEVQLADVIRVLIKIGEVESCVVHPCEGGLRFALASFETQAEAALAVEWLDGFVIRDSILAASWADTDKFTPLPACAQCMRTLYVKRLPVGLEREYLVRLASPFGAVEDCVVASDGRGIGFVVFRSHLQAYAAFKALRRLAQIQCSFSRDLVEPLVVAEIAGHALNPDASPFRPTEPMQD